jgi:TPR repeat protein
VSPWREFRGTLQNNFGYAYQKGLFGDRDPDAAIVWYQRAISNSSATAANNLAELYEENPGYGVSADGLITLYRIAAQDNIGTAQNNLGVLLLKQKNPEAIYWFERAAQSRNQSVARTAQENLSAALSILR